MTRGLSVGMAPETITEGFDKRREGIPHFLEYRCIGLPSTQGGGVDRPGDRLVARCRYMTVPGVLIEAEHCRIKGQPQEVEHSAGGPFQIAYQVLVACFHEGKGEVWPLGQV